MFGVHDVAGIPFNGWYADSEIVRNMTDEGRFNIMPEVAERLGYNLNDNASLWRDAALNVVNEVYTYVSHVSICKFCLDTICGMLFCRR